MIIIRRIYYIRWAIISPGLRELCHRLWANPTYDCGDTWGSKAPPTRYTFQCLSVTAKVSCYTQLITVIITVNLYSAFLQETSNALTTMHLPSNICTVYANYSLLIFINLF